MSLRVMLQRKGFNMFNELQVFRSRTGQTKSLGNYSGNVIKEIDEALEAVNNCDELGLVCEYADWVIYSINELALLGFTPEAELYRFAYESQTPQHDNAITNARSAAKQYAQTENIDYICMIAGLALGTIRAMGFNAEQCVLEKAKCINSRKGEINHETGKWEKDPNQDKSELYKPNYESCRKELAA